MWLRAVSFVLLSISLTSAKFDQNGECQWLPDTNNTSTTKMAISCRYRTLDSTGVNLSALPIEGTSKLKISCSEDVFYESFLPSQALQRLHDLQELNVEGCKILRLEPNSFDGLANLKKISLKTFNSEWSTGKSLEINGLSFAGLKELQSLNLSDNNVRAVPEGAFCVLQSLKTLNLTNNRLRSVEQLGFGDGHMSMCASIDLQILDLSHNEIRSLPEISGLARLRRLQELDLKHNNISFVSGEALAGLVNLRTVNFANNKIENLPQGLFAGSMELREVDLQNNSLSSLAKGVFNRLEQLIVLDLSENQLTSEHIDAGTFTGLIRLIVLNLSYNSLTRIDGRTFKDLFVLQILDLRNNSIGFIEDNAFLPLYNLHTLNLAENRLNTVGPLLFNGLFVLSKLSLNNNLIVSVDNKAFQNCSDLKELNLSSNALQEVPDAVQELIFLETLDLGENQISDFRNGSFKNLDQLTGLRLFDNNIGNLTKGMFWDLPALQLLNLGKNKIQSIERGTFDRNTQIEAIRLDENFLSDINGVFASLATLLWLKLSENHLVWFDYAFIPSNLKWLDIHNNFIDHLGNYYKIQDEIRVKTLDASHNRISEVSPMAIPNSVEFLFINHNFIRTVHANTFLDKTNLARVDMYVNDLVNLELESFRLTPVPFNKSLPEIYLGGIPLHCDCTMEWLQRINNMSYTRSYPRIMDLDNIMCRMTHSRGMTHMPLVQANPSDFLCTYETLCPHNCSCYQDETWNTNVVDCSGQNGLEILQRIPMDVTELYLDGNDFKELENDVFIGRKNMKVLYANGSGIETIQNRTFNGLNALRDLHLEDNKIAELKGYEFENLSHLKELYLQNNIIARIASNTFASLNSLEIVRLDGNKLVNYPIWEFSVNLQLDELSIGNNPWSCRCKFLQVFTVWVAENAPKVVDSSEVTCSNRNEKSKQAQVRELDFNTTACTDYYDSSSVIDSMLVSDYLPMTIATLCLLFVLLAVLVLWFIYRDSLRAWFYSKYGVRLCNFRAASAKQYEDRDKLYDAFVCYSPKDEEWVVQSLAPVLETSFVLCLHYRDLPHAAPAVLEAADASRRMIIILTRNFLQTEWSRIELRQAILEALKGRVSKLVILQQTSLPEAELDLELRPYLKTGERIFWEAKDFLEKLRRNMHNYTIESGVVANRYPHTYRAKIKNPSPSSSGMQMFPLSYPAAMTHENEDPYYSSATTPTPSPRPTRRAPEPLPISDHIYSSIDSDSTLERGDSSRRGPPWRPHILHPPGGSDGQAYLG